MLKIVSKSSKLVLLKKTLNDLIFTLYFVLSKQKFPKR